MLSAADDTDVFCVHPLISNVISIDYIINVFCGRVLIIMSVMVNAIRDISCMHI